MKSASLRWPSLCLLRVPGPDPSFHGKHYRQCGGVRERSRLPEVHGVPRFGIHRVRHLHRNKVRLSHVVDKETEVCMWG